jgi:hypothetical protein
MQDTSEKEVTYNTIFTDRPFEMHGVQENSPAIADEPALNHIPVKVRYASSGSLGRLVTIPMADLKFQCEHINRLSEMLSQYQGRY